MTDPYALEEETRSPIRTKNIVGWFLILLAVLWAMQHPQGRTMATLLACVVAVAALYVVGAFLGWMFCLVRGRRYSHAVGLTVASVFLGLLVIGPHTPPHPILDISGTANEFWAGLIGEEGRPQRTGAVAGATSVADTTDVDQAAFEAAYREVVHVPGNEYLLAPGIKEIFDREATNLVAAGRSFDYSVAMAKQRVDQELANRLPEIAWLGLFSDTERNWQLLCLSCRDRLLQEYRNQIGLGLDPQQAQTRAAEIVIAEANLRYERHQSAGG